MPPCDASLCAIRAFINPSFSTDADETKLAHIVLERSTAKPVFTHCTCTDGLRKDCSHVGAVLFVLCDIVAEGHEEIPADPTCTKIKCKWSNPKGANCEPKLVEDLHIYKAKFGTEPAAKGIKPSASFADKLFKFDISAAEHLERKMRLKNDILSANKRDCLPPIFHLIGAPTTNSTSTTCDFNQDTDRGEGPVNNIDVPFCLEVEIEETECRVHEETTQLLTASKSCEQLEDLISPPKCQPVSLTEIKERADKIKKKLFVSQEEIRHIEKQTRNQANSEAWYRHRRPRITASKCKRALIKPTTSPTKAMKEIMCMNSFSWTSLMEDGLASEQGIIQKYSECTGNTVQQCGFFISEKHPFLGASPDGLVGSEGLVEVKKVHPRESETLYQALLRQQICKSDIENPAELVVNKNHRYYCQVQQQLLCTQRSWGDFVASDGSSLYLHRVTFDEEFWRKRIPQLEKFYHDYILLELAYPRVKHGLDRLGKFGITYDRCT